LLSESEKGVTTLRCDNIPRTCLAADKNTGANAETEPHRVMGAILMIHTTSISKENGQFPAGADDLIQRIHREVIVGKNVTI